MTVQEKRSKVELVASLPEAERKKIIEDLTEPELEILLYDWKFWARPKQLTPAGDWYVWVILAGRGWGKSRTGAEQVRAWQEQGYGRFALVGQTPAEVRDVMVEGESGILAISPPDKMPKYEPSKRKLTWPNGATATAYSAENPDLLRGPQHDKGWFDELAKSRYPQETWDNLMLGLRGGDNPQVVVTTTPKPIKTLKEIIEDDKTVTTKGTTYENKANLAGLFIDKIVRKYEGTRLGRQELYAEMLDDNPDALWQRKDIEDGRTSKHPELKSVVVAIDPQATNQETSSETGIIVAGKGIDDKGYVLEDISIKDTPEAWARNAVTGYYKHNADRIVGEVNNGGDMVEYTVKTIDRNVPFKKVHASRGKQLRAEPISALYEQGRVHHVGMFAELEDQMCEWVPGDKSPDRLDALVWALTELMVDTKEFVFV